MIIVKCAEAGCEVGILVYNFSFFFLNTCNLCLVKQFVFGEFWSSVKSITMLFQIILFFVGGSELGHASYNSPFIYIFFWSKYFFRLFLRLFHVRSPTLVQWLVTFILIYPRFANSLVITLWIYRSPFSCSSIGMI